MERRMRAARREDTGDRILRDLAQGTPIDAPVALVVAHPDDETLGVGTRITRLRRLTLIHLTDGAPRAQPAIAAQRKRELSAALDALKAMPERRIAYGCPDQETVAYLPELANALRHDLAGAAIVITHAYEYGHPDHDTAALAVHVVCAMRARADTRPCVIEFPSYHLEKGNACYGVFWPDPKRREWIARLEADEQRHKARALTCFASQSEMLRHFPIEVERFRRAPDYDFREPAPPRAAWYDQRHWDIDSRKWRQLARRGLRQMGFAA